MYVQKFANFLGFALALRPWASPVHTSQYNRLRDESFEQDMIHAHVITLSLSWGFARFIPFTRPMPWPMVLPAGALDIKMYSTFNGVCI